MWYLSVITGNICDCEQTNLKALSLFSLNYLYLLGHRLEDSLILCGLRKKKSFITLLFCAVKQNAMSDTAARNVSNTVKKTQVMVLFVRGNYTNVSQLRW